MKSLGMKTVKVSAINLPGGMKQRMERDHVKALAATLDEVGLLDRPKVRQADMRIIVGRDRVAAHMVAGREDVQVEMYECTDEEAVKMDAVSNAQRRHDPEEQRRLMVQLSDIRTREFESEPAVPTGKVGRPVTPRGKAREVTAAELGVKAESVRQAEYRAKKLKEDAKRPPDKRKMARPKGMVIEDFGIKMSDSFFAECSLVHNYLTEAAAKAQGGQRIVAQLISADIPVHKQVTVFHAQLGALAGHLKLLRPKAVCPWCKAIEGIVDGCARCEQRGWVTVSGLDGTPEVLLRRGDEAVVMDGGEEVLVSDLIDVDGATWEEPDGAP